MPIGTRFFPYRKMAPARTLLLYLAVILLPRCLAGHANITVVATFRLGTVQGNDQMYDRVPTLTDCAKLCIDSGVECVGFTFRQNNAHCRRIFLSSSFVGPVMKPELNAWSRLL